MIYPKVPFFPSNIGQYLQGWLTRHLKQMHNEVEEPVQAVVGRTGSAGAPPDPVASATGNSGHHSDTSMIRGVAPPIAYNENYLLCPYPTCSKSVRSSWTAFKTVQNHVASVHAWNWRSGIASCVRARRESSPVVAVDRQRPTAGTAGRGRGGRRRAA